MKPVKFVDIITHSWSAARERSETVIVLIGEPAGFSLQAQTVCEKTVIHGDKLKTTKRKRSTK
ncbi:hypothetical protein JZ751_019867 [Albula glossodonta]|uniref:Uncharacterized protein n=1 Tax=Albula glossodonta TaxID=121402 RepID=A0A8T2NK75_9TELE|nr:hypothetical protein JZ751_019867 [Albula glossodonta]